MITGQLIHECYNSVIAEDAKRNGWTHKPHSVRSWKSLSKQAKKLYNNIAHELNAKIEREEQEARR